MTNSKLINALIVATAILGVILIWSLVVAFNGCKGSGGVLVKSGSAYVCVKKVETK